jgi:CXXX repeat modification system protein
MAKNRAKKKVEAGADAAAGASISGLPAAGRKKVGQVSAEERDEIKKLFERKNALLELARSLNAASEVPGALYEKLLADLGPVSTRFSAWWAQKGAKYRWERTATGRWEIDFDTCEIFLIS